MVDFDSAPLPTVTPQHGIVHLRHYPTPRELEEARRRSTTSWGHIRPNSVLVCAMSNHYAPTAWQHIIDMVLYSNEQGIHCGFSEIMDRCFNPYDALGTMRNEAWIDAATEGYEWLCYVDCDIQPEKDALLRLLKWDMPVVVPYIVELGTGKKLHGPGWEPNTGLRAVRWAVLSMLLMRVSVLKPFRGRFWGDAMGADEGYHFKTLWSETGHRPYLDTTVQVPTARKPTYPLATNHMLRDGQEKVKLDSKVMNELVKAVPGLQWEEIRQWIKDVVGVTEREEFWRQKLERFAQAPDRRPVDPNSPHVHDGMYMPFASKDTQGQPLPSERSAAILERLQGHVNGHWQQREWVAEPIGVVGPRG